MDAVTRQILKRFEQINAIPRCSKNEKALAEWMQQWARDRGFDVQSDAVHNTVVRIPATGGMENAPTVVFQAHLDMVCEKTPESTHDFTTDPIRMIEDGDWLTADGTSLGADNGAAVAMGMVLAETDDIARPPMELLLTVDEETGLTGANELSADFIRGRILLNVDSEDEGVFTVGCAGGEEVLMTLPVEREPVPDGWEPVLLDAGGLHGGHSGIDIAKQRGNAIRILARALGQLMDTYDFRVVEIEGGTTHNAIPREAFARLVVRPGIAEEMTGAVAAIAAAIGSEYRRTEPHFFLNLVPVTVDDGLKTAMTGASGRQTTRLLLALPTGVDQMSTEVPDLVETSNNLAVVRTTDKQVEVLCSQRSAVSSRLEAICRRIEAVADLAGAASEHVHAYPPWPPDMDSPLLKRCRAVYEQTFGTDPTVEIIHAGLECAIIGSKYPGMDMISFGPTMENPHSPNERLYIPSIEKVWRFVVALLASYGQDDIG